MSEKGVPRELILRIHESEFAPEFLPYLYDTRSVQLFIGNTGSGKSKFVQQRAILNMCRKKYYRCPFSRSVKETIRDSIFQGLKDVIIKWGMKKYFTIRENEMDIVYKINGNMLLSYGMDDTEKLKSISDPSDWIYDEFSDSLPNEFAEIQRRLRTQIVKFRTFTGVFNPVAGWWGRDHFFVDNENDEIPLGEVPAKTADTLIYKATYHKNPFVNAKEIRQKNEENALLDENHWIVYELGNWGKLNPGGEFYHQFKRRLHVAPVQLIPNAPYHISYDFNVLPYMTLICTQMVKTFEQIDGKQITLFTLNVLREYCFKLPQNTTEDVTNAWLEDYGKYLPDVFYYGDAMGNKRHEGTGNKTEFKKVREILARLIDESSDRTYRGNPSVRQSRNFINKILAGVEIVPGIKIRIVIDPSCKELIADMENCKQGANGEKVKVYVKDKVSQLKYEKHNHASDALSYLITKAFEDYFKRSDV